MALFRSWLFSLSNRLVAQSAATMARRAKSSIPQMPLPPGTPPTIEVPVLTLAREQVGTATLDSRVFLAPVRTDLIHRVVLWQLAARQAGTHKSKNRSETRGSTRKIYKQKGTGSARAGSIRAVQRRGGGTVHGPIPRSHAHDLPKKVRKLGLCSTLSAKLAEGNLIVMDDADIASHKTKELVQTLSSSGWNDSMLIFVGAPKRNLDLATRNLGHVTLAAVQRINVYEILRRRYLFLAKDSLPFIHERLLEDAYDLGIDDDDVAALSSATE